MTADPTLGPARLPRGELVRSRVITDPATVLRTALESGLNGYITFVPQESLLLDGDARGVVTFEDGVPACTYNTETERGGSEALADVAIGGPYRINVFRLSDTALDDAHQTAEETASLRVPPGMPAEEWADAPELAARTRERAPADRCADATADEGHSAVESFLADDERIEAIREQARQEAADRAAEWGLDSLDT